ncbi:MAG: metallophosphoesterase [Nanoarchaeota archaeon]|nr:metallophosphoesterase [Nanoarchaeota archaeon]
MNIYPDINIVGLGLHYKNYLIIGDLQLGYEEYMAKHGALLPRFQYQDIKQALKKLLEETQATTLIINGDIKHEFGTITEQEWRDVLGIIDSVNKNIKIIFVKGNHDLVLGPIAKKRNVEMVDYYNIDNITITHGDKLLLDTGKIIIIGHEHPALSFPGRKDERYKCFLKGIWNKKTLIVVPSFSPINPGMNLLDNQPLSPYLQHNIDNFEVYIIEDKPYYFGTIKKIKKELL